MKKWTLVGVVYFIILSSVSISSAEEMKNMQDTQPPMKKEMMMDGKKMLMMGPMMKAMEKSMVATEDGGVIVLAGNKLIKYDKDLNVVKEADIKVDMVAMQKQMSEMMKMCPMMKDGMKEGENGK